MSGRARRAPEAAVVNHALPSSAEPESRVGSVPAPLSTPRRRDAHAGGEEHEQRRRAPCTGTGVWRARRGRPAARTPGPDRAFASARAVPSGRSRRARLDPRRRLTVGEAFVGRGSLRVALAPCQRHSRAAPARSTALAPGRRDAGVGGWRSPMPVHGSLADAVLTARPPALGPDCAFAVGYQFPVGTMPAFSTMRITVRSTARVRCTTPLGITNPWRGPSSTVRSSRSIRSLPSTT